MLNTRLLTTPLQHASSHSYTHLVENTPSQFIASLIPETTETFIRTRPSWLPLTTAPHALFSAHGNSIRVGAISLLLSFNRLFFFFTQPRRMSRLKPEPQRL